MPGRLIHVVTASKAQLVSTSNLEVARPYAALSYVWGYNQTYVLQTSTVAQMYTELEEDQLAKSISDAFAVTNALGLAYLWVDALCIMQDSADDLARELATMGATYSQAAFTIVAASASTAQSGFLDRTESHARPDFEVSIPSRTGAHNRVALYETFEASDNPIDKRAWTMQEKLLSPRLLIYTTYGLELSAHGQTDVQSWAYDAAVTFFNFPDRHQAWRELVETYASRMMSNPEDKLLAIAAVAETFGTSLGGGKGHVGGANYLAGLWRPTLLLDLLWHRRTDETAEVPQRPTLYRAPSWSWAAVDIDIYNTIGVDSDVALLEVEILESTVRLADDKVPFGRVAGGEIVIKGLVKSLAWRKGAEHLHWDILYRPTPFVNQANVSSQNVGRVLFGEGSHGNELPVVSVEKTEGRLYFDALEPALSDQQALQCLAIGRRNHEVLGLVLVKTDQEKYRRVGYFDNMNQTDFHGARSQVLRIV